MVVEQLWCKGGESLRDDCEQWSLECCWLAGGEDLAQPSPVHDEAGAAGQAAVESRSAWVPPQGAGAAPAMLGAERKWGQLAVGMKQ